jgi:(2R)-3-sulfolactate dehydrogenase (NADP+)
VGSLLQHRIGGFYDSAKNYRSIRRPRSPPPPHSEDGSLMLTIHNSELIDLCRDAILRVGADRRDAQILAEATIEAELVSNRAVGVTHLFDYLEGYRERRIAKESRPMVRRIAPAVVGVDARDGLAQSAFAEALDELQAAAHECGIAALWIKNSYTCGELGYYPRHLAQQGFIALATANSPALMSLGGSPKAVLGTNPLAYGVPRSGQLPVVIDQASSSTAFVNIRRAAEAGDSIPAGWAVGPDGKDTQDAKAALNGTLLPFGGHRGGNIALLVEILATLCGASFSLDAAPFDSGTTSPRIGVFVLCIDPATFDGSVERLMRQFESLRDNQQVRLPAIELTALPDSVTISAETLSRLRVAVAEDHHPR